MSKRHEDQRGFIRATGQCVHVLNLDQSDTEDKI